MLFRAHKPTYFCSHIHTRTNGHESLAYSFKCDCGFCVFGGGCDEQKLVHLFCDPMLQIVVLVAGINDFHAAPPLLGQ